MKLILMLAWICLSSMGMAMQNSCTDCHEGLEDIRDKNSGMMQAILVKADEAGVKGNDCVICHGGKSNCNK